MTGNPLTQPLLGPDFSAGVLEAVDRHRARGRRFRWLTTLLVLAFGVSVTAFWRERALTAPAVVKGHATEFAAAAPAARAELADESTADPLSYMFPDAEPLARYEAAQGTDPDASALFDDRD